MPTPPFRRLPALLPCLLLLTLASPGAGAAACAAGQALTLLHFNDFHGQLEAWRDPEGEADRGGIARLARAVAAARAEDPERPVLLLFAGDLLQGTLTSSLFRGRPDVALFGRLGVDAAVLGNHEFDQGQAVLRDLAGAAAFPFLAANLRSDPDPLPVRDAVLIAEHGAPPVAILGLLTPDLATATHPRHLRGIRVEDPLDTSARLLPELRARAGLVIVLSHLGLEGDRRLARAHPEIDLIVGGHDHHALTDPVLEGSVAILQAGARGGWLGRLDLDCRDGRLARVGYRLLALDASIPADPAFASEVARLSAQAERDLLTVAGRAAVDLDGRPEVIRRVEAPFGNLLADLARAVTQADVALLNGGGVRASIPAGPVTLKQVHEALPFRNELVVGTLSGARLRAALERSAALAPANHPGGFLQVSGVRAVIAGRRLEAVTLADGTALDPARRYRLVTHDFLAAGGDGYDLFNPDEPPVMTGRLLIDVLIEALRQGTPLGAPVDGRIRRLSE